MSNSIESAILTHLESGDKTIGELLDFAQCGSYPVLNVALKELQGSGRIEAHFENGCLQYRLIRPTGSKPFFLAWQQQEQPQSRFLWNNPAKQ